MTAIHDPNYCRLPDTSAALRRSNMFYAGEPLPSRKQERAMEGRRKGKSRRRQVRDAR